MCTYHYKTNGFINRSNMHVSLQAKWLHQHIKCANATTRETPSSTYQMCTYQMCTYHYKINGFISRSNVQMLLQERHLHQHIKCARITTIQMASSVDKMCTDQMCKCYCKRDTFINISNVHRSNMHVSLQDKWLHQHIKCARITTRQMASSVDHKCKCYYKRDTFINISNVHVSLQDKWLHQ